MLSAAAGAVNGAAFLAARRFVSHVTGSVTEMSLARAEIVVSEAALLVGSFVLGAMTSVLWLERRHYQGRTPSHAAPLVLVCVLLCLAAVLGTAGVFGPFGGSSEGPDVFLVLLTFAMGLQNAAVATSTGLAVRTTHLTGPSTDLGVKLATAIVTRGEARRRALTEVRLRGGHLLGFAAGVVLVVLLARRAGYLSFLLPAALVAISTARSFLPEARLGLAPSSDRSPPSSAGAA